jgi:pyridinium-3,5-bisthiocarboxylic acid mononucleotide nickel chelatase
MRIAYLDCFSGMSGDMFLGALVDAGVSPKILEEAVAALNVDARLEISRVNRSGISASRVDVYVHGEKEVPRENTEKHEQHHHHHDHNHDHEHKHSQSHEHEHHHHSHEHAHGHGRGLTEIRNIIRKAAISDSAKNTAISIFEVLGVAEAKVHGVDIEKIHFHEVGAVDAMVDIVCASVGAEALGVDEIICSPLNVGGGTVECEHGTLPVPVPAVVELLKDAPLYSAGIRKELLTPTGAAIVKVLVKRFGSFPEMKITSSGYGAGGRDLPGHPNVVRLTVGEALPELAAKTSQETISVLEANIDDLNPQVFGYVMDRLLEEGALDCFGVPVQMKKNRPGTLLTVLCKPEDAAKLTQIIFTETTTLGVRHREEKRQVLSRKWITVPTQWGDVRMKIASMNGTVTNYAPEYEDCRKIAGERKVPLKAVMNEAMEAYAKSRNI